MHVHIRVHICVHARICMCISIFDRFWTPFESPENGACRGDSMRNMHAFWSRWKSPSLTEYTIQSRAFFAIYLLIQGISSYLLTPCLVALIR